MEKFKDITREELKKWMDEKKDFVLIDVLAKGSYEVRHLPGAKHAAGKEAGFLEKVEKIVSTKEAVVVVYCSSFTCHASPRAANLLVESGYTNVYDFRGGLADWQDAEYVFEGEVAPASTVTVSQGGEEKVKAKCDCCS